MAQGEATRGAGRIDAIRERERHWRGVFAEQRTSGLSHSEFCRQRAISMNAYFWWKRELPRRDAQRRETRARARERTVQKSQPLPSLVPVRIRGTDGTSVLCALHVGELVLKGGRLLRVPAGFDAEELRRLVAILEESRC